MTWKLLKRKKSWKRRLCLIFSGELLVVTETILQILFDITIHNSPFTTHYSPITTHH